VSAAPRTLVTGGTRGIGAAVVRRLARNAEGSRPGHEVVALGRTQRPEPPPWARSLRPHDEAVRFDGCDVTDAAGVAQAFERANADGAGLTGLVVSAGVWEPSRLDGGVEAVEAQHRRVIEVNLLGAVSCVAAFLEQRREGAEASVVLVGSTAGQRGESGYGAYAASKAALMGLAKSWAVELGPSGVRVNVVAPGWVATEMTAEIMDDEAQREVIELGIPRGRVAEPEDLAGPIAFLLSEDSGHVTGTVLSVNGGGVLASY
jgi:3-oxoacyl-[acyl-carrier protein] reductase